MGYGYSGQQRIIIEREPEKQQPIARILQYTVVLRFYNIVCASSNNTY